MITFIELGKFHNARQISPGHTIWMQRGRASVVVDRIYHMRHSAKVNDCILLVACGHWRTRTRKEPLRPKATTVLMQGRDVHRFLGKQPIAELADLSPEGWGELAMADSAMYMKLRDIAEAGPPYTPRGSLLK